MPTPIVNMSTSPEAMPSGSVVWNGPEIPCLKICSGQSVSKVLYIIATKLCELSNPYDLANLSLQCALDMFKTQEPATRTIANILQLALNNGCGLRVLIDSLQSQVDGLSNSNLVLNLKCLAVKDAFGNTLSYNEQTVFQLLIDETCALSDQYDGLSGQVGNIQNQINTILNTPKVIEENVITTCLATEKPVSGQLITLSNDYCNYKGVVGQNTQIQSAIALQPSDLNTVLSTEVGWVTIPSSMATSLGNAWIALNNHEARIKAIENTCCKATCDDVKVGYEIAVSDDGKFITLRFTSASGTYIPAGLTDQGSKVVISDGKGSSLSYNISIEQDGETDAMSIVGLDANSPLLIDMTAKIGSTTFGVCVQCVPGKSFTPSSSCPVCKIEATGNTGSVTLIYQ